MELTHALIPIGGTIGGAILLSILAASLPESAAWLIRRWVGFWSSVFGRTHRKEVRDRAYEIEGCFWDCYDVERADGSGATRATTRALWIVFWEVLIAPKTVASAAAAVSAEHIRRFPQMRILPGRMQLIARVSKKQVTVGPIAFLLLNCPGIVYSALFVAGLANGRLLQPAFAVLVFTILAFRRRHSFTSKLSRSLPRYNYMFLFYYFFVWTGLIASGISSMPEGAALFMAGAATISVGAVLTIIFKFFRVLMDAERIRIVTDYLLSNTLDVDEREELLAMRELVERYP